MFAIIHSPSAYDWGWAKATGVTLPFGNTLLWLRHSVGSFWREPLARSTGSCDLLAWPQSLRHHLQPLCCRLLLFNAALDEFHFVPCQKCLVWTQTSLRNVVYHHYTRSKNKQTTHVQLHNHISVWFRSFRMTTSIPTGFLFVLALIWIDANI